jgi:hypothetical protein
MDGGRPGGGFAQPDPAQESRGGFHSANASKKRSNRDKSAFQQCMFFYIIDCSSF